MTYVYRCTEGHEYEVQQGINEDAFTECGVIENMHGPHVQTCDRPVERVPQRGFFKITGPGVYSPGFK